jgi:hypothetical protein
MYFPIFSKGKANRCLLMQLMSLLLKSLFRLGGQIALLQMPVSSPAAEIGVDSMVANAEAAGIIGQC